MTQGSNRRMAIVLLWPLYAAASGSALLAEPPTVQSDSASAAVAQASVFRGPKRLASHLRLTLKEPYPSKAIAHGIEGWVNVSYVVDVQGKTRAERVESSSGVKLLEEAALEEVRSMRFEPASDNGVAVESAETTKLTYVVDGTPGPHRDFVDAYARFEKDVHSGNLEGAIEFLESMKPRNLFEDAYYGLAQYLYARRWGTERQQLEGLVRAMADETDSRYLPDEKFEFALESAIPLEISAHEYRQALANWQFLVDHSASAEALKHLQPLIEQVQALRASDQPITVRDELNDGYWSYWPIRSKFRVHLTSGHIAELHFRCKEGYFIPKFQADVAYELPEQRGACSVEFQGDPGTTFELVE